MEPEASDSGTFGLVAFNVIFGAFGGSAMFFRKYDFQNSASSILRTLSFTTKHVQLFFLTIHIKKLFFRNFEI